MAPKAAFTLAVAFSALLASAATIDKRIVNGIDVKHGEIKFIVSIRDENKTHNCGGSLLDDHTVLTAAHCIHYGPQLVSVTAGTVINDINTDGVEAKVISSKMHPDYKPGFPDQGRWEENDIAILKLATPINKTDTIEYATLPPAGWEAVVNSTAVAAGWGAQKPLSVVYTPGHKNIPAKTLSKVALPIHAREDCAKYDGVGDRDTVVCAGGRGKNVCFADSGGPLFDGETGLLLGVVSWSIEANDELCNWGPGLFSKVSSYIDFINENLGRPVSDADLQRENVKKLEALRAKENELCKELGKDLDQCRPQVAECVFRASAQKNNDVDEEVVWAGIKACVKQILG